MPTKSSTIIASKALLLHNGRALLLRRSESDPSFPGMWEFPGGKLEFGESPPETARRELQEETGINVTLGPVLYVDSILQNTRQYIIIVYLATAAQHEVTLSFEHTDFLWATEAQMKSLLTESQLATLEQYHIFALPHVKLDP